MMRTNRQKGNGIMNNHGKHYFLKGTYMRKIGNDGFSFVEILVALGIASFIMASVVTLVKTQARIKGTHEQVVEVQQNIRAAMYMMERELKMAGYKGNNSVEDFSVPPGFISPTDGTTVTFTYLADNDGLDNDNNGSTDEAFELVTVQYLIFDGGLGRRQDNAITLSADPEILAENIQLIEFFYSWWTDPFDPNSKVSALNPSALELPLIESVEVSTLARSRKSVPVSTGGAEYETPSKDIWGDDENFDDGYYRRYASSNILCRNLQ